MGKPVTASGVEAGYVPENAVDGKNWTQVADMSKNTKPTTPAGDSLAFKATDARFIRVNMLKNSANQGVHLVEVRAYEAGK